MPSRNGSRIRNFLSGGVCAAAWNAIAASTRPRTSEKTFPIMKCSLLSRKAAMPPEHDFALQVRHQTIHHEAENRYDDDAGEDEIDLELEAESGNERPEPFFRGHEFRHERSDEREGQRSLEPGKNAGERGRPGELPEHLGARGDERAHEEKLVLRDGLQAYDRVDHHREEGDRDRHHYL